MWFVLICFGFCVWILVFYVICIKNFNFFDKNTC